jgi:hypothetical protein
MWHRVIFGLIGLVPLCPAQTSPRFEIKLPPNIPSGNFFARYTLEGDDLGGWIQPRPGLSSYSISTVRNGRPASGIRAILYAPGCAIQTFSLPLSPAANQQFPFVCQRSTNIALSGMVIPVDRLYKRPVKLQARYVARWAGSFLGLGGQIVTVIPIGDVTDMEVDSRFHLTIPDLSQNVSMMSPSAELQIWAIDKVTDQAVALLIPQRSQPLKTRMGGLRLQSEYPVDIVFAPCTVNADRLVRHDADGFAQRPTPYEACDR